jgi:hypothetical protein
MPILNPNTTNYSHTSEPNLSDLHSAMRYNASGETVSVFISSGGALTRTAVGLTWLVD